MPNFDFIRVKILNVFFQGEICDKKKVKIELIWLPVDPWPRN